MKHMCVTLNIFFFNLITLSDSDKVKPKRYKFQREYEQGT